MARHKWLWLFLLLCIPSVVAAQPSDLLISEYIEGSSNNKAIEIYNGTGAAINLATDNYVLQFYFNGSTSAGLTISLTGTVAEGDVYVVAQASANASILAQADQTNGSGWYNGDDAVVLRKGGSSGTIVDVVGQVGNDPGTEWGSGLTSTADNTLRRKSAACVADTTPSDTFDPSVNFDGYATDNIDSLGSQTASCGGSGGGEEGPTVSSTTPANSAPAVAADANILITFSEDVNVTGTWFTFEASGGGSVAATVSGGPTEFTINPDSDLQEGETYTVTVIAANVTDQDGDDPPDSMEADYSFSFTVQARTRISAIQGSGSTSPMTNQIVTIQGIVVGDFQENDGDYSDLDGFYVQEETEDQDSNAATSEGIFVFAPGAVNVLPGNIVRVTGRVTEFTTSGGSSLTEIGNVSDITVLGTDSLPVPVDVEFPFPTIDYPERFEGMYVRLPQELFIAEYFNFDRFNEIVLAYPLNGMERPFQPTSYVSPGAAAQAVAAELLLNRITLDDARGTQNPNPALHPNGGVFNLTNTFRGGDVVQNVVGVMEDRFGLYRIQPTQGADYTASNPRDSVHADVGGCLKVASFNVLNYFLTINDGPFICGPNADQECRGANTAQEFQRQRGKILAALSTINADIFGLIEMENTAGVEPLEDIVEGLNDILGAGTYDYIVTGTIGTDAIKVGIIYKPAFATPVGGYATLTTAVDPRFLDNKNRPALAQTFRENASDEVFTVVVNHLKSKGSDCNDVGDPDLGDGQGNCNVTRTQAAHALVDWLASDPTGSDDPDYLIIGDLNSYDEEDPINAIKAGTDDIAGTEDDYVDLIEAHNGEFAYSYVFDGQLGYLDYALATKKLTRRVTGAADWHINSDEVDLIDYDMSFKAAAQDSLYEANPFRASDHDPVIVGLDMGKPVISIEAGTAKLWPANHNYQTISLDDLGITVTDNCDQNLSLADVIIARVWSDEAENASGNSDGNTNRDMVIAADCRSVMLRAERNTNSNGRVYTLKLEVMDENGNIGKADYKVKVPITNGGGAVDNGQAYFVEGCNPDDLMPRIVAGEEEEGEGTVLEDGSTFSLNISPGTVNPSEIAFELEKPMNVQLALYDIAGKEVLRLTDGLRDAGDYRLPIDFSALANGVYIVHLTANGWSASNQIIIAR